jgi:hypothetical protein
VSPRKNALTGGGRDRRSRRLFCDDHRHGPAKHPPARR